MTLVTWWLRVVDAITLVMCVAVTAIKGPIRLAGNHQFRATSVNTCGGGSWQS